MATVFNDVQTGFMNRFRLNVESADVVHIFRFPELVGAVRHERVVWDIDELPDFVRYASARPDAKLEQLTADYMRPVDNCNTVIGRSELERPLGCDKYEAIPNVASTQRVEAAMAASS